MNKGALAGQQVLLLLLLMMMNDVINKHRNGVRLLRNAETANLLEEHLSGSHGI
jgi:hypothetical protein